MPRYRVKFDAMTNMEADVIAENEDAAIKKFEAEDFVGGKIDVIYIWDKQTGQKTKELRRIHQLPEINYERD